MGWINELSADAHGKHAYALPGAWEYEIGETDLNSDAVPEEVEFVAQRLLVKRQGTFRWILGSPIYVARTGRPATNEMLEQHDGMRELYSVALHKVSRRSLLTNGRQYIWEDVPAGASATN